MEIFNGKIDGEGLGTPKDAEFALFEQLYPEFKGCFKGTINCHLDTEVTADLFKVHFGYQYKTAIWEFIRIEFEYPLGQRTKGWIYSPFGHHWGKLGKKHFVEVALVREIQKPNAGEACRIHLLPCEPYRSAIADRKI